MIMSGDLKDDFLMIIPDNLGITRGIVGIPLIPYEAVRIFPNLRARINMESKNESVVWFT